MGSRARIFFQYHFKKALSLLQVLKGRPLAGTLGDVESDTSEFKRSSSIIDAFKDTSGPGSARSLSERLGINEIGNPDFSTNSNDHNTDQRKLGDPQYTEGSAQFIVANDGSKECIALLVTSTLTKDGPLTQARMDVRNIGQALRSIKDSLETTKNQEEAEKLQRKVQQQEQGLLKACKRKDDLERQFSLIESNIARARKYTQYVIETAMNEANLAPRAEMPPGGNKSDTSGSDGDDQDRTAHDVVRHVKGPSFCEQSSVIPVDSHALASHSEIIRRVAYEDFIQKSEMLHRFRATFDNQQLQYGDDLADYQQGAAKGTCKFSRSGFDRRDVDPARKLTGGLVALEQACDKAEGHARAPGATKSTSWSSHYSEDEESRAGSRVISHNASYDWSRVHEWLEHVPQCEIPEDPGNVEIDDWDWREVDPEDSISQKACALLDDPQPEEFYLGQIDERPLERRRSF